MSRTHLLLVPILSLLLVGSAERTPSVAQGEPQPSNTKIVLEGLVHQQIKALNDEDPMAVMGLFHPKAPGVQDIHRTLVMQFRRYDDVYRLIQVHYIGVDGPWAYMRTRQSISGQRKGQAFVMGIEELLVFRRHGNGWRAWTSARLDQITRKPGPPKPRTPPRRPR